LHKKKSLRGLKKNTYARNNSLRRNIEKISTEHDFSNFSGSRVVFLAEHPHLRGIGYGSQTINGIKRYHSGFLHHDKTYTNSNYANTSILPRLLSPLPERYPEILQYITVTDDFSDSETMWRINGFEPVHLMEVSEQTRVNLLLLLKEPFFSCNDTRCDKSGIYFKNRLTGLCPLSCRSLRPTSILSVLQPTAKICSKDLESWDPTGINTEIITFSDYKRLILYSNKMIDFNSIADIIPAIARAQFKKNFSVTLNYLQSMVLVIVGLQHYCLSDVEMKLVLDQRQVLKIIYKTMKKVTMKLRKRVKALTKLDMISEWKLSLNQKIFEEKQLLRSAIFEVQSFNFRSNGY
jgi:N-acetyltransferase 10